MRPLTRLNTSQTIPAVVSPRAVNPASAHRFAAATSQGRSPLRNSTRWKATGATMKPVASTEPHSTAR